MNVTYNDLRVKDLKSILNELPDDMIVIIPVVDENDVNNILGFRKVRTVGILEDDYEEPSERLVLCLNGAAGGYDMTDQVRFYGGDIQMGSLLFGYSMYTGPEWPNPELHGIQQNGY